MREMLALRFELFRLEAISDLKNARRLLIVAAVAGVLIFTSLPLFAVALADVLAGVWQIARWGWLLIFAGSLLDRCRFGRLSRLATFPPPFPRPARDARRIEGRSGVAGRVARKKKNSRLRLRKE